MNKHLHCAFVSLLVLVTVAADNVPSTWRTPKAGDLGQESGWRAEDANRYLLVRGDFDGDGKEDSARLLINDRDDEVGLFVTMGSAKKTPVLLDTVSDKRMLEVFGIRLVKPGSYATACGKGYWECDKGEPEQVHLKNAGIDFFAYEKGNSFFIWNAHKKQFDEVLMSD